MSLDQYYKLRNALIVFMLIVVAGCAFGIREIKHAASQGIYNDCTGQNDNRIVLRNLLDATLKEKPPKTSDKELQRLIKESQKRSKVFVQKQKAKIPTRECREPGFL